MIISRFDAGVPKEFTPSATRWTIHHSPTFMCRIIGCRQATMLFDAEQTHRYNLAQAAVTQLLRYPQKSVLFKGGG